MLRALLVLSAVSALATLPCLVALLISVGPPRRTYRFPHRIGRWLRPGSRFADRSLTRRERRGLIRLDRCFGSAEPVPAGPEPVPIERIAADLRRLRRQRAGIAQRSPTWRAAIEDAYDDRLRLACARLRVEEHLDELAGVDRAIERVRLEGALQAAGLRLSGYEAAAQ